MRNYCNYISVFFLYKSISRRSHNQDTPLSVLESKRKKLTDMLLDDKITKDAYDEKYNDFTRKINQEKEERSLYASNVNVQGDVGRRMKNIRTLLTETEGNRQINREGKHYNLQMIIAVGFKVNNQRAVRFCVWANQIVQQCATRGDLCTAI